MTTTASSTPLLKFGIIVLTAATAAIHLYLGLKGIPLFVLNGFGYLGLLAALTLPLPRISEYRNLVRWVLVGYAALTILLWILVGARNSIGYADKVIELALVALLILDARGSRR